MYSNKDTKMKENVAMTSFYCLVSKMRIKKKVVIRKE